MCPRGQVPGEQQPLPPGPDVNGRPRRPIQLHIELPTPAILRVEALQLSREGAAAKARDDATDPAVLKRPEPQPALS